MKQLSSTSNFKIYTKRILSFLLALICVYGLASVTAFALDSSFDTRDDTQRVTACQLADFYSLTENSLDVLILGSSHAMCSYDPARIEREYGLYTFNLGTALQQPDTAYYLLKEVLKTQKPKYLIYDVYFKTMVNEYSNEQALTVLKELPMSKNALALFWSNLNLDGKVEYYNNWISPFGKIQDVMETHTPKKPTPPDAYMGKGFYSSTGIIDLELLKEKNHPFPAEYSGFHPRQVTYLKKLINLAQENDIEVILTSAPLPPTVFSRVSYYDEVLEEVLEISDQFDISFYDFTTPACEFLQDTDFADQGHLNRNGCVKFMDYFIPKIKEGLTAKSS